MFPEKLGTYVYLASLSDTYPEFAQKAKEHSTFNSSTSINGKKQAIQPIRDAMTQLKNIADTQAQKEHQAIENYLKKIDTHLKKTKLPEELRKNLERQKDKIKNIDFKNYTTDSLSLIQAINVATQNLNNYEKRLNEITQPVIHQWEFQQRFEFDIQSRLEKFFQNIGKQHNRGNAPRDKALSALIEKEMQKTFNSIPKELSNELKSLLFVDFNNWIEVNSSKKSSYTKLTVNDIEPLFNEYLQLSQNQLTETRLQRVIRTSDEDLLKLLNDMKGFLHSTYLTDTEYKQLQQAVANSKKGEKKTKIDFRGDKITFKQAKDLVETYNYNLENNGKRYAFTLHSKVSHGNFYELISTFLRSAVNIEANVAGDLILPIGTATFTEQEQQSQKALLGLADGIQKYLTKDFKEKSQITMDTFEEAIKNEENIHATIRKNIEETRQSISEIEDITGQYFIAHETTKLYRGAEQQDSLFEDFHGRLMSVLSAMAKLYASPTLSAAMVDPKMMMLYLINISDATLAVNKQPLETYLSLFAGLLMYDDISELATYGIKQIQSNVETSTIECIHVYNIGGIYFPISVILNDLLSQMDNVVNNLEIDNSRTATVELIGPTPVMPEISTLDSWKKLADDTIQATKIQIHFLAGYSKYISELFTKFNG